MKLLPSVDTSNNSNNMTYEQNVTIIVIVYVSVICYALLLSLEIHNLYYYIYLQKKYKVFPLSLFYALCIPCTVLRIYENIWIVQVNKYILIWVLWSPAIVKLCISLS